ncbi:TIGR01459 family HAD-type hydrolase [Temperatibacter marinus]|uniref:TIGR01459 family HAD-type hydrolase n=1 Tax=Temperatibacter marinus TaxID=1456591 RepID=A0AA52EGS9_9PROT|nr:TIGR01459 family HAD-type hydrolase [Temperatibacter marinus]WND02868.1 TIGR01459 family HAD-type hydrolase [Temperatibacter marinus]
MAYVPVWDHLKPNLEGIKLVICDLWGVMHNGVELFPEAVAAIEGVRREAIETVFLTNAPKPASLIREQLNDKGLPIALQDNIMSSGAQARAYVREHYQGKSLYHMGPSMDHQAVEGLPVTVTEDIQKADLIFASGLDHSTVEAHDATLEIALRNKVPFLCANPDRVVHFGHKLWLCAGSIAEVYEGQGGETLWFGKPSEGAFQDCAKLAGMEEQILPHEVLVIGDSLLTDIAGAQRLGHKSLLITTGIHRKSFSAMAERVHWPAIQGLPADDVFPTALMAHLRF